MPPYRSYTHQQMCELREEVTKKLEEQEALRLFGAENSHTLETLRYEMELITNECRRRNLN